MIRDVASQYIYLYIGIKKSLVFKNNNLSLKLKCLLIL